MHHERLLTLSKMCPVGHKTLLDSTQLNLLWLLLALSRQPSAASSDDSDTALLFPVPVLVNSSSSCSITDDVLQRSSGNASLRPRSDSTDIDLFAS